MIDLAKMLTPEIVLIATACLLFVSGFARRLAQPLTLASIALMGVLAAAAIGVWQFTTLPLAPGFPVSEDYQSFRLGSFALFARLVILCTGVLMVMLAWPRSVTGNAGVDWGRDPGEFFGLMLLSLAGLTMVPAANDLNVLFMSIELASLPTYILVAMSRPFARAQESGLKYFFLGALSAALLLLGFAYIYGATGTTRIFSADLVSIAGVMRGDGTLGTPTELSAWSMLGLLLVVIAMSFKLAAFPMYAYVGDVYEGAGTAVTAFIGFVPKALGVIVLLKILSAMGGGPNWMLPETIAKVLIVMAIITMTLGNVLALAQRSVKRMLAYSSVAHSGYLLAGIAVAASLGAVAGEQAVHAVLFYLAAYAFTSAAAFGALMRLPSRQFVDLKGSRYALPATSAETFDDLQGIGRHHPALALAMTVAMLSLIGIPLTAGFWSKYFVILPPLTSGNPWLLVLALMVLINSAIAAAYYLRVIGTMFSSDQPDSGTDRPLPATPLPVSIALGVAVGAIVFFGAVPAATQLLSTEAMSASQIETQSIMRESSADISSH
jgi:NADH-quinone oxidoreductase subunit N